MKNNLRSTAVRELFSDLFSEPMDSAACAEAVDRLSAKFGCRRETIARSHAGRPIEMLTIGDGSSDCLYVGAHHGMESITSALLSSFAAELSLRQPDGAGVCYRIIPMLNPDGVDLAIHGISALEGAENPIFASDLADFWNDRWQANGRGVDLNHNYNARFADYRAVERELGIRGPSATRYSGSHPESEPEVAGLCRLIRAHSERILAAVSLHSQGREIYWTSNGFSLPGCYPSALGFAHICGYTLSEAKGAAGYGGMTDYLLSELRIPAITVECGRGVNPLPMSELETMERELLPALMALPRLYRRR